MMLKLSSIKLVILTIAVCFHRPVVANDDVLNIPVIKPTNCCTSSQQPQRVIDKSGYIISPRIDPEKVNQTQFICSWLVDGNPGQSIKVIIRYYQLGYLKKNMLIFYDGFNQSSSLQIANYTGLMHSYTSFQTNTSQLYIKYVGKTKFSDTSVFEIYFEQTLPLVICNNYTFLCKNGVRCFTKAEMCNNVDDCADGTDEENCSNHSNLSFSYECGHSNAIDYNQVRIIGGNASQPGEWPWMVSMRLKRSEPEGHTCGATIINRQWLVTAAHCAKLYNDTTKWTIHAAKYRTLIRDKTEVIRYIKRFLVYPQFIGDDHQDQDNLTWYDHKVNDIALVQLNAPLPDNNTLINAICLPNKFDKVNIGETVTVAGWGTTYNTGNEFVLKQTSVPIITHKQCREWMPEFNIGKKMICAGFEKGGQDSCRGDSGGPLFRPNNNSNRYDLVGIVSTGGDICGDKRKAGIYTEVQSFLDWINNATTFETDN